MTFGAAYIVVVIFAALRWRSKAAWVALPPLIGTVAMVGMGVADAGAYSSAMWTLAGGYLILQGFRNGSIPKNSEYVAGALYGISGIVYVAFYLGASDATLAFIPIISDIAFGAGLVAGTWPNAFVGFGRYYRRGIRRTSIQIAREDLARSALRNRGQG